MKHQQTIDEAPPPERAVLKLDDVARRAIADELQRGKRNEPRFFFSVNRWLGEKDEEESR